MELASGCYSVLVVSEQKLVLAYLGYGFSVLCCVISWNYLSNYKGVVEATSVCDLTVISLLHMLDSLCESLAASEKVACDDVFLRVRFVGADRHGRKTTDSNQSELGKDHLGP